MRTARFSDSGGGLPPETSLDGDPLDTDTPPQTEHWIKQPDRKWHHRDPPPPAWTEWLTHACENITFPKLRLRPVIRFQSHWPRRGRGASFSLNGAAWKCSHWSISVLTMPMHGVRVWIFFFSATCLISVESESEEESVASDDKVEDPEKVSGTFVNDAVTIALRCRLCPSFTLVVLPLHIRVRVHFDPMYFTRGMCSNFAVWVGLIT